MGSRRLPSAEALSGGTDLISRMKDYVSSPERIVYLKDVKALRGGRAGDHGRHPPGRRGRQPAERRCPCRQATLEVGTPRDPEHGGLRRRQPAHVLDAGISEAASLLGIKDGKSLVRNGDNRYHSIFLTEGDALFVSPSSLAVPLIALGAQRDVLGPNGKRVIPIEKLYQVTESNDDRELTLSASCSSRWHHPGGREERLV